MFFTLRVSSGSDTSLPRTRAFLRGFGDASTAKRVAYAIRDRQAARSSAVVLVLGLAGIGVPTAIGVTIVLVLIAIMPAGPHRDMTPTEGALAVAVILGCAAVAVPFFLLAECYPDLRARRTARRYARDQRCLGCGYDMTNHAGETPRLVACPECGSATPVAAASEPRTIGS